jgi:DNA-binding response OmpR family regulator
MNKDNTILVVDDSPPDLKMTMNAVKEQYKVLAATSGASAIDMVTKTHPDVVLMDVNMPEMDGYQTCEKICSANDAPLVIFISANDATEEILRGYEVGGADYIVKPFTPEILLSKIESALTVHENQKALRSEVALASDTAMSLMASAGDLGVLLEFVRSTFNVKTLEELAKSILLMLSNYQLSASAKIAIEGEPFYFSHQGETSPLEKELLKRITDMSERLHQTGKRCFLTSRFVYILIKNMPVEDEDRLGRVKDCLAIAVEAASERALMLITQGQAKKKRNEVVSDITAQSRQTLSKIHDMQQHIEKQNIAILDELQADIEDSFVGLALSDEQEQHITDLLDDAHKKSAKVFEKSAVLEREMAQLIAQFSSLQDDQ